MIVRGKTTLSIGKVEQFISKKIGLSSSFPHTLGEEQSFVSPTSSFETSPDNLPLIYVGAWGDGLEDSIAFKAEIDNVSPDSFLRFFIKTAPTQEELHQTPYILLGEVTLGSTFEVTKAQFDSLLIPKHIFSQVQVEFVTGDTQTIPELHTFSLTYVKDSTPPEMNASDISMKHQQGGNDIPLGSPTKTDIPFFSWQSGIDSEAGIKGYCLYLGEDADADPETSKGILGQGSGELGCPFLILTDTIDFATESFRNTPWLTSSQDPYYLNIKAIDKGGNIYDGPSASFSFLFDNTPPTNPGYLSLPTDFISSKDFTITWPVTGPSQARDEHSQIAGFQYKIGENGTWYGDSHTGTQDHTDLLTNDGEYTMNETFDYPLLQEGSNNIFFRTFDSVGNISQESLVGFSKINTIAPSTPQNLSVTPQDNTTNAYAFSWNPPEYFTGQEGNITYCYSINTLPNPITCTYTGRGATTLNTDAFATQPGDNTLYLVARDEAGNTNYDTRASVTFTYSGTAPGIPQGIDIADVSVKVTESWKLALSWEAPENKGAGVDAYHIYRSKDGTNYTQVATSSGISHVDTELEQTTYFYKVKACDSANNCGAFSSSVSLYPDGKFTDSASLLSGPNVEDITTRRATIEWVTARKSDSRVQYGKKSKEYYDEEPSKSEQSTEHSIELSSLSAGTRYYYRTRWMDEDGNMGMSDEKSFET
ncbi:MAG: hypothetical protein EOM21_20455, partial [Gammaproteobacteria bacterium]|nr:hypothetical protein [Gammaproteobacteria bacterium]